MPRSRWLIACAAVVALALTCFLTRAQLLRDLAAMLMTEDRLAPAEAIIVLGGETPFRQIEAASLFHHGVAPLVVMSQEPQGARAATLESLGIHEPSNYELGMEVLSRLGVPPERIITLPRSVRSTRDELALAFTSLRPRGPVILLTTRVHTRRAKRIWLRVSGGSPAIVRAASTDPLTPDNWWYSRTGSQIVATEFVSLLLDIAAPSR